MDENKKFDKICRICTEENAVVEIFSEEGKEINLEGKIRKYLYISVYVEDKLPKMVCSGCKNKLDSVDQFATMALKMQQKLKKYLQDENSTDSEEEEDKKEVEQEGNGSLLHSILTKGYNNGNNSPQTAVASLTSPSQSLSSSNGHIADAEVFDSACSVSPSSEAAAPSTEVTEVEVRIDPMLFLCDEISNEADHLQSSLSSTGSENCSDSVKSKPKIQGLSNVHLPQTIKEPKPYQCNVPHCPRGFNTEIGLQNHLWGHSPLSRKVLTTSDLNTSRRRVISKPAEVNGAEESNEDDNESLLDEPFICPMCGKKISTKGNLKVHMETHRPKGKYACDTCGRVFKTQSNLLRHKEYHGGVQYPCQVCGRVYPTNSTLRAHSITHSNLRPHKCPLCDKTFKRNQDLKFHINQHTGARPYKCPYCPKAFASSGNCFSHRKRMHPGEVERDREMADEIAR